MERSSRPTNNNIDPNENDDSTHLHDSYIEFINTSNASIRMALDIIYNQQISFNQLISTNRLRNINSNPQFNSTYQTNNYSTPISTQNRETFNQPLPTNTTAFFPRGTDISHYFTEFPYTPSTDIPSIDIPSIDERDTAIEYTTFSSIDNALNTICPISHRDFSDNDTVIQLRECRHVFDSSSILQWFTRNSRCPLCRNDIRFDSELEVDTTVDDTATTTATTNTATTNTATNGTDTPSPFAQQLASLISNQISNDIDFSGNINIELAIPGRSV